MPYTCIRCRQVSTEGQATCACSPARPHVVTRTRKLLYSGFGLSLLLLMLHPWRSADPITRTTDTLALASGSIRVGQKLSEVRRLLPDEHCAQSDIFRAHHPNLQPHHYRTQELEIWIWVEGSEDGVIREIELMPDPNANPLNYRA